MLYPAELRDLGDPYGTRTRVYAVKGRCPRPLDEKVVYNLVPTAGLEPAIHLERHFKCRAYTYFAKWALSNYMILILRCQRNVVFC